MKTSLIIACLLLLIANATMPYGYYQFLRIAIAAGITSYDLFKKKQNNWLIGFVLIMILYNPIFVIHLDKAIWKHINIVTAVFFGVFALANKYKTNK
jgi:hypothetical protein